MTKRTRLTRYAIQHLAPLLRRYSATERILDLGCGKGAVLNALAGLNTRPICIGVDNNLESIAAARAGMTVGNPRYVKDNIHSFRRAFTFDTVLLCDVVEHVGAICLFAACRNLDSTGIVYVSFPPWHGPYGGHQQLTRWKLPWLHLFGYHGHAPNQDDIDSVHYHRLTVREFEDALYGWRILHCQRYIMRPERGRAVKAPRWWPDLLTAGVEYVLTREQE